MYSDSTVVKFQGAVKPQEEAKAQYEKAVKEEKTAFLVEENKPDIFKVTTIRTRTNT
jgi:hypothetical protein